MAGRSEFRHARLLRPAGFDELGVRRALSDRILPALVAAMSFLAALALAGGLAAAGLAGHWRTGAATVVTVQVPRPTQPAEGSGGAGEDTRLGRALAVLHTSPGVVSTRVVPEGELSDLLRPWLGAGIEKLSLPIPAVIELRMAPAGADLERVTRRLESVAPGTLVESHGPWFRRLAVLAHSLVACAAVAALVVALVASMVVVIATRAGLSARREAIEIVHDLGASDGYIAGRFSRRVLGLAALGGLAGAVLAMPVLLGLATLAAPFAAPGQAGGDPELSWGALGVLPASLWLMLPGLPVLAAGIGFLTAQGTVRQWLRRLP